VSCTPSDFPAPPIYNDTVLAGADWFLDVTYQSAETPPVPYDLTGWSAALQIRQHRPGGEVLIELTDGHGITFTDAEEGQLQVRLTAAQTAALPAGSHSYDLIGTSTAHVVHRILQGRLKIDPATTVIEA
jgi:hypothetical protein